MRLAFAASTVTVRNVAPGHRDATGRITLTDVGDVTVTLHPMTRAELADWEWATDTLNIGIDEHAHRLAMRGWTVRHAQAGVVGLLFQGAGTRVHVEWFDPTEGDFLSAGHVVAHVRHGAAAIVHARQHAGHGLPADPAPARVPAPARTDDYEGLRVRYHGSIEELHGETFNAERCACGCGLHELWEIGAHAPLARHVRGSSLAPWRLAA
ncbi:hypothetical protein [Streptomyces pseudogriseolus]|uniref:hypothetical protein n=1 Tax=Streptomyces pseudogriseolus TaxID=36817 RepID=UPI003FA25271